MDLLEDYAGSEPLIVDGKSHHLHSLLYCLTRLSGESLLQIVLDDPLLAIGRENSELC